MNESGSKKHNGAHIWGALAHGQEVSSDVFTHEAQVQAYRHGALMSPSPSAWERGVVVHWTGFEPFGGHAINPSWAVAQAAHDTLDGMLGQDFTSLHTCLPVTYACASAWHGEADVNPDVGCAHVWIHIGLAADRPEVCFERSAYNATGVTLDNEGCAGAGHVQGLVESGSPMLHTALDLEAMSVQWRALGLGVDGVLSDDPGRYVCNATYYHALRTVQRQRAQGRAGAALFVHVPMVDARAAKHLGRALARVVVGALPVAGKW